MNIKPLFIILIFSFLTYNLFCQNISEFKDNINEAEQTKDTLAIARAWYKLGRFYDINEQISKSNEAFNTALFFAECINSTKAVSSIANYLASNFSTTGQTDSAIYYYTIALDAGISNGDSLRLPPILINLGNEYANTGNYIDAANYSISAIQIKEQLKDSTDIAYYYQKVGEVYKTAGENDKWIEYTEKAYQLIDNKNYANINAIAAIYNDLGGIAEYYGNYEQALLYYDTLISVGEEHNFPSAIGVALSNRATVYKHLGDIEKAISSALEAKEYKRDKGYQYIYDNNLLSELYLEKQNSDKALQYALLAINYTSIDNYPDEKMRAFKNLYKIEKNRRNYKDALLWNENYKSLSDSIRNKEIRTQILDMEIGYQTEKKEHQIELLTTENQLKNQRLEMGVAIVAILIILIFLILYILHIRKKQSILKQNDLQQQVLRAQMNPHFIFNVLGSIQNFMLKNDNRKASSFLSQFASLTRATLNNSTAETISLANEISMLKNYIELERMRSSNKFDFEINYDENLEIDFIKIPPMLIQPFVENSIKHGFNNLDRTGLLRLNITDKTDWVEFVIEDDGNGVQKNQFKEKTHQSMAMNIFEKRRKLIQYKFNKDFKFEFINLKDANPKLTGVRITVYIPVINND